MGRKGRRERRGQATAFKRYQMNQKLVALGNDFYIEDEQGQNVFKVDGKVLRIRDTLVFKDMEGNKLCQLQEQLLRIKDTMKIDGPDGKTLATVKKALITPVRDRWSVKVKGAPNLDVQGNILDHEYRIEEGRHKVAEVSKKWFRVRDTYGVEVAEDQDQVLILAVTVAIDIMAHPTR